MAQMGSSLIVMRWARASYRDRKLRGNQLVEGVRQLCFSTRLRIGSYQPFARLVGDVIGKWTMARCRTAIAAAAAADAALKNTTISDDVGVLSDFVLTLAASRPQKVA